ncbi:MAG TPA: tetratricopeptide repeat protein, partial [Longimicrobiaceae bacterium]|nr:tetratricopeptide repeat protein [Longimicrobiaceae bacterium]
MLPLLGGLTPETLSVLTRGGDAELAYLFPALRATEQSLASLRALEVLRLEPLSHRDVEELVRQLFGVDEAVTREFTALLYGWTRGNPFFLEETLKSLVHSGRLYRQEGSWLGWDVEELHLPRSVRDAVLRHFDRLTPEARAIADLHGVLGTSASYELLRSVSPLTEPELVAALDELRREHILDERMEADQVVYDFRHPLLRETLYAELGLARARLLHGTLAQALEAFYGAKTAEHVDELAFHFARAGARHLVGKTVQYLSAAGCRALERYAYREAADYLGAALERADEAVGAVDPRLVEDLARARQRLGEYDAAIALWERARADAQEQGDVARLAAIHFRLGLAYDWSERNQEALAHYEAGLEAAAEAGDEMIRARLKLKKAECLQELGRPAEAQREIESALEIAEGLADTRLLANVHRALLLLHTWMGPPDVAREHGQKALALAEQIGDGSLACALHWGLAVLAGLTGAGETTARHLAECERLVEELRLPLHRLWIGEVAIEYASATGDWDAGIALGERYIALSRAFNQRSLLPRLLVWTALIYFGRGDLERGKRYVDEAWELSGAGSGDDRQLDVHIAIPAHTGLAGYHLAAGEFGKAIEVGEAGLAIADRSGYAVWSIHRLLPIIAESALWLRDLARARQIGERVRRDSERLGHRLGLAWVDACDALVVWLSGEPERAISLLRRGAEQLEAIPLVWDAARLRRHLA